MRTQRRLLQALLNYANGTPIDQCVFVGIHRDADALPVLYVPTSPVPDWLSTGGERKWVEDQLAQAIDNLDGLVGALTPHLHADVFMPIFQHRGPRGRVKTWHGRLVPRTDTTITSWAACILAIACCTPTGEADCLANRIALCDHCGKFFLLPTSRPSRVCSADCRKAIRRGGVHDDYLPDRGT